MKTHEIAKILTSLATMLRSGPDVELGQLGLNLATNPQPNPATIPMALSALVALSKFTKDQWRAVIDEHRMPIDIRPSDGVRDVIGKIFRHLENDPDSLKRLKNAAERSRPEVSPELMNALNRLLK